ncbi:MAG: alanine--tRNA ligase [Patescibacteria group bacterium]|jgi:alanyl-tRNA synthetase
MTTKELRQKYLSFFESKGHTIIPGASLLPENDPTVLFTTAGMHPLVPYLLGEKHASGNRLTDVQKCIRTGDIDEVGDGWHLTFFEMLGNWSLGDLSSPDEIGRTGYFKKEAIEFSFEFLTKELNIPLEKLAFTCFAGEGNVAKDEQSAGIWESLEVSPLRIKYLGMEDNWWPAGGKMPGPQGPDTEMFYWSGDEPAPEEFDPKDKKWVEIWNDVFMQYNKTPDGKYEPLKQQNVDTGMGLERTVGVLNGKSSVYEIEPLATIMRQVTSIADIDLEFIEKEQIKPLRIITDHIRASVFILAEKIAPSNVEQGYVLRKLIRRSIRYGKQLGIKEAFTHKVAEIIISEMGGYYPELRKNRDFIMEQLAQEEEKFSKTLENGLKKFEKIASDGKISGEEAFVLFSTYGFPFEITKDLAQERKIEIDEEGFNLEFSKHQEISRQGAEQKFKGGLADSSETTARMHTATHLMLSALRKVLGDHVFQKGSNITAERIRYDFSHPDKMTPEQIKQVEDLVNEQIQKAVPVICEEMSLDEAKESGAMGIFEHKYGDKVKVYTVGDFSKEICGGPHAGNTSELGHFKIQKEESSSAGVRRIKAILE